MTWSAWQSSYKPSSLCWNNKLCKGICHIPLSVQSEEPALNGIFSLIQRVRDQSMRFPLVHNLHFLVDIYRGVCHYLVALFCTTVNPCRVYLSFGDSIKSGHGHSLTLREATSFPESDYCFERSAANNFLAKDSRRSVCAVSFMNFCALSSDTTA